MTIELRLLGGASLEGESGAVTGPAGQRHRLALLALLAVSPTRGRTREKLLGLLWPERDAEHARKLLNQSVYVLRKALGEETILSVGDELRLDVGRLPCDAVAFEEALAAGERETAVRLYGGAFLDGFHLDGAPEFERWTERVRTRLEDARAAALEELAAAAERRGDHRRAARWWKLRAGDDPYDVGVALELIEALARAGDLAGAVRRAETFGRRFREELGIEPPEEVAALVERLRSDPPAPEVGSSAGRETPPADSPREPAEALPEAELPGAEGRGDDGGSRPGGGAGGRTERPSPRAGRLRIGVGAGVVAALAVVVALLLSGGPRAGAWLPGGASSSDGDAAAVDSLARAVAREVSRRVVPSASGPSEPGTSSLAAAELFERGNDPVLLRSPEGARRGVELLRRAVALDSSYAQAWAGLAWMLVRVSSDTAPGAVRRELHARAEDAARTAVALDDGLPEAHAALGFVRMAAFDLPEALVHLRRAVELAPSRSRFRQWLAGGLLWTGRRREAVAEAERALADDPTSPSAHAELARTLVADGRCPEALERLRRLAELRPPLLRVGAIEATCRAEDVPWLRRRARDASDEWSLGLYGHFLARAGAREEALRIREELEAREGNEAAGAFPVAMVDAGLGEWERAFDGFEDAVRDRSLLGSAPHFTMLEAVRETAGGDPRLVALAGQIGLALEPPSTE